MAAGTNASSQDSHERRSMRGVWNDVCALCSVACGVCASREAMASRGSHERGWSAISGERRRGQLTDNGRLSARGE